MSYGRRCLFVVFVGVLRCWSGGVNLGWRDGHHTQRKVSVVATMHKALVLWRRMWSWPLLCLGALGCGYFLLLSPGPVRVQVVCKGGPGAAAAFDSRANCGAPGSPCPKHRSADPNHRRTAGDDNDADDAEDMVLVSRRRLEDLLTSVARNVSSDGDAVLRDQHKQQPCIQPSYREWRLKPTSSLPTIYVVTPTYRRPEQMADLTRLAQTLMLVPNVHWLVVEDAKTRTPMVADLLRRTGFPYQHLLAPMPQAYVKKKGSKPRGVSNRLKGLQWIREHAKDGVIYFCDDDNTYDIRIFEEMRWTKTVSMWPVGLLTSYGLSSPVVRNGRLVGFYDGWQAGRKYPVDMAGFAVSVKLLLERPNASMPFSPGYEEDGFLKSLQIKQADIQLKADNCTKLLVWHTQTKKNVPADKVDVVRYNNTNLMQLKNQIVEKP